MLSEIKIKNNKTKEEETISLDAIIYYLDEKLNEIDEDECNCGGHDDDHECNCGKDCKCNHKESK